MANEAGQFTVNVPDVGEGVAEVEIVSWTVAVGDSVARLQTVAEVMTDKATVEVPSPVDGVVAELGGDVGEVLLVGSPLIRLTMGASTSAKPADESPSTDTTVEDSRPPVELAIVEPSVPGSAPHPPGVMPRPHATGAPLAVVAEVAPDRSSPTPPRPRPRANGHKPLATPAVRRRARDAGVDLRMVAPSGPADRITHDDLDQFLSDGPPPTTGVRSGASTGVAEPRTGVSETPMVGLRRKIATQMVASSSTIPHITYVEEVDVTGLEDLRADLNQQAEGRPAQPRLTILPFLIRAMTNVLVDFPQFNAHLIEAGTGPDDKTSRNDVVRQFDGVHIGIATQTDNGLVVPVLRHAETHTIWSAATTVRNLSETTRSGQAAAADLSGSTITITSLGPLGGIVTTPVINKPEVAIIGVNKIMVRPVWIDGEFVPRKIMNLSSSFDHRVIDGWDAANFIQALRAQLEQPALLFIDPPPAQGDGS